MKTKLKLIAIYHLLSADAQGTASGYQGRMNDGKDRALGGVSR